MTTDETRNGAAEQAQPGPDPRAANDDLGNLREGSGGEDAATAAAAARSPEEEAAELRDRLLRTLAEMENLRARTAREVDDARKYAVTGLARDLLEAADNLRRALASVPAEGREAGGDLLRNLLLGVEMTERTLLGAFEKHRIRRVEPQRGERFDPNLHQAMFEVPTDAQAPGTVAEVVQAGYVIADRLLRPALVGVAKTGAAAVDTTA